MTPAQLAELSAKSLALMKEAQGQPNDALLKEHFFGKAYTQSSSAISGITAYDLEAPAKMLYPVPTPFRNKLPRLSAEGGIQANWRAVTGVNTGNNTAGVSEGNRNAVNTDTTQDYIAVFKELGMEQSVTFKAELAARGFQDLRALASLNLLKALMIAEEKVILGGNTSLALGNTPTPTVSQANTGGTLLDNTAYRVGCVALTFEGFQLASVAGGIKQTIARTNADGSSDTINGGTANPSALANISTANASANTHTISASVTAVPGAFAYAWYLNAAAAGPQYLAAITTINSVLLTAAPSTANQQFGNLTATDYSLNSLEFDGLLTFASNVSLNSLQVVQATGTPGTGTPLTAGTDGTIAEFDTVLKSLFDNYRLSPSEIWVSSQEMLNIRKKVLTGTAAAAQRFVFDTTQAGIIGGTSIKSYTNPFTQDGAMEIPIKLHPFMPAGTVYFHTDTLPYPMSNVAEVTVMRLRRDYYQIEWPLRSRKYEFGVYMDGVLQHYFPPSVATITNIGNG